MRLRAGLTGQQARDILTFLQSSNFTVTTAAAGSDTDSIGLSGEQVYNQTCIACHGADGGGAIPGVPKFKERLSKSDDILFQHIIEGFQSPGSPMAMPARGGNPNLSDQDIQKVLSYIKNL
ncbi:MAG: cytochrome c [Proteobacteria bacterium]|nr:cytochrome c [Pseudomonadota bacterium]